MTTEELTAQIEAAINDLDEQRHRLVGALLLLKPESNVVQLPRRKGPKPGTRKVAQAA